MLVPSLVWWLPFDKNDYSGTLLYAVVVRSACVCARVCVSVAAQQGTLCACCIAVELTHRVVVWSTAGVFRDWISVHGWYVTALSKAVALAACVTAVISSACTIVTVHVGLELTL